jgi:hypothetical protein
MELMSIYVRPSIFSYQDLANSSSSLDNPPTAAAWDEALAKAKKHLHDWTLEDKVQLVTGVGWQNGACVGNIPPIEKRGWKGLCLQDSVRLSFCLVTAILT